MKPSCHIDLDPTLGYGPNDPKCPQCIHKVSCLLGAIDVGNVRATAEEIDTEVEGVRRKTMTMDEVKERIVHRQSFIDADKSVPGPLRHDAFLAPKRRKVKRAKGPAPARRSPKPKFKIRQPKKPGPKPKPKPPEVVNLGPVRHYKSGRKLPSHRRVERSEMEQILKRTNEQARSREKPRFPFDLSIGMELVHHTQKGDVVVQITENGWCWNGELFTSISTAWCHALKRSVSGFDLFDVNKGHNVSIRGPGVPGEIYVYRDRDRKK